MWIPWSEACCLVILVILRAHKFWEVCLALSLNMWVLLSGYFFTSYHWLSSPTFFSLCSQNPIWVAQVWLSHISIWWSYVLSNIFPLICSLHSLEDTFIYRFWFSLCFSQLKLLYKCVINLVVNKHKLLLTILEAGCLRSGCQHSQERALFPAADHWLLPASSRGGGQKGEASSPWLLQGHQSLSNSKYFPRGPHLLIPSHWGIRSQCLNMGEIQTFRPQ